MSFVDASSFGVTPPSYIIDFEPGLEQSFEFDFLFDDPEQNFEIILGGELRDYVTVRKIEGTTKVEVNLKLPQAYNNPGPNSVSVGARAVAGESGDDTGVGISALVSGIVLVNVPYPGKYADLIFRMDDANAGEQASYRLAIYSRGEEQIVTNSQIIIYDSEGTSVKTFNLGSDTILPGASSDETSLLDVSDLGAGSYNAEAVVSYSGEERRAEDDFSLGSLVVNLINYTKTFDKEKINQMYIDVESGWNDQINGVYAEGKVVGYEEVGFTTPSIELKPWRSGKLVGHLDTTPIQSEEFQMDLTVHYGGKITEERVSLKLRDKEVNYLLWGGIALGVLLVLGFIVWVVVKLKSLEGKSGRKKRKK